tara:strand:+ start:271 stop:513 length:243 start_codon:yes stop_codon:yes gene_type:complete
MELDLNVGDIIIDKISGEIGLLIERYLLTNGGPHDPLALWAWDVYWVGQNIEPSRRLTPWTEYGLINIINAGTFMHFKNI